MCPQLLGTGGGIQAIPIIRKNFSRPSKNSFVTGVHMIKLTELLVFSTWNSYLWVIKNLHYANTLA